MINTITMNDYAIDLKYATEKYLAAKLEFEYYSNLQELTKFLESFVFPENRLNTFTNGKSWGIGTPVFCHGEGGDLRDYRIEYVKRDTDGIFDTIKMLKAHKCSELVPVFKKITEFKLGSKLLLNIELHLKFRNQQ
jgi:hypothetical protein